MMVEILNLLILFFVRKAKFSPDNTKPHVIFVKLALQNITLEQVPRFPPCIVQFFLEVLITLNRFHTRFERLNSMSGFCSIDENCCVVIRRKTLFRTIFTMRIEYEITTVN